ncbi:MAG: Maf family protein [Trichloromonadaceae bacterium]
MRTVVLASTSPYRLQLMRQLGIQFHVSAPLYEEHIDQRVAPELLVKHLAGHKAKSLKERYPDALIIGADQVFVSSRGAIMGKPGTVENAVEQLRDMSGRSHTFYTGLSVFDSASGHSLTDLSTYTVTLRKLTLEQIRSYVERDNPLDCAGSFKIEGLGITLMESMAGDDYTTLIGLPLIKLTNLLLQMGMKIP